MPASTSSGNSPRLSAKNFANVARVMLSGPAACGPYARTDLIVVPRRRTPVTERVPPLKPYDAAAHGVALVMNDLPALAEIAAELGPELVPALVPPGDLFALEAAKC